MKTLNTNTLAQLQISQVIEHFNQSATSDLIEVYNEYASNNGYERVYDNDELILDDMFTSHFDAIRAAFYGDYNPSHAYFTFNGYGNLQSFEYLDCDNSPIDIEELAQWIIDNELYNDYDIEVTTLEDMYDCILDNLEDASSLDEIINLAEHLGLPVEDFDSDNESPADYENNIISDITNHIYDDFELLTIAIEFMQLDI